MMGKLLFLIAASTLMAAILLTLRQQRVQTMYEIARLHRQIDTSRHELWRLQAVIAPYMRPGTLTSSIARMELELEPITPNVHQYRRSPTLAAVTQSVASP